MTLPRLRRYTGQRRHGKAHADRYAAPANTEGRTASTDCGAIPRWLKPAASGLATLSVAMRSTWLRVIGGLGSTSHISASACQIAKQGEGGEGKRRTGSGESRFFIVSAALKIDIAAASNALALAWRMLSLKRAELGEAACLAESLAGLLSVWLLWSNRRMK